MGGGNSSVGLGMEFKFLGVNRVTIRRDQSGEDDRVTDSRR